MKTYEIDFNGLLACKIEVKDNEMIVVAAIASTIMRIFIIVRHPPNRMALMDAFVEFTRDGCALYHSRVSDRERTRIGASMGCVNCTSEGSSIIDKINSINTIMNDTH